MSTNIVNDLTVRPVGDRECHIERTFNASRDRVWAAYTQPELLAQWWGPGGCTVVRWEFERGGHWRLETPGFENPDDTQGFEGRFREVTPKDRIVWTFEWDGMPGYVAVETVEFIDLGDRTKIVTDSLFHTTEERDGMLASGMEHGLAITFNQLDALLAGM